MQAGVREKLSGTSVEEIPESDGLFILFYFLVLSKGISFFFLSPPPFFLRWIFMWVSYQASLILPMYLRLTLNLMYIISMCICMNVCMYVCMRYHSVQVEVKGVGSPLPPCRFPGIENQVTSLDGKDPPLNFWVLVPPPPT